MRLEEYATRLGALVANLLSLEFLLRRFLYARHSVPHAPLSKAQQLHRLVVGDEVPLNALTDYSTLGTLISRYNSQVALSARVDASLAELRDAIAHGRISAPNTRSGLVLLKFAKPLGDTTRVTHSEALSRVWFAHQTTRLEAALRTVAGASGARWKSPT